MQLRIRPTKYTNASTFLDSPLMSQTGSDFVGSSARSLVRHTVISRSEVSVPIGVILLFYSREGRKSQDAALLMAVVGQFV
ncbi:MULTISPECIES: hypothetical protein, partial [unclassified Halorhodospira]|uniref:hypothetical protein n=1 Tax=unclassified Halorhodospira TaxID=2626748 RepID=UPI001EE7EFE6